MTWTLAPRTARMEPSTLRELLKLAERPGVISLAGGLPSPETFPVAALREACDRVLREAPHAALQYAASEGLPALRDWVAEDLRRQGLAADPARVLITSGSQQGLDLVAKVLVQGGAGVAVETPTYLGALQAFNPFDPRYLGLEGDDDGPLPEAMTSAHAAGAQFAYLLPNFQNPTGRCMSAQRRDAIAEAALRSGLPVVEDNPYGDLWFDAAPPPPLSARLGDQGLYLGSFSKVLAPGLRLGYLLAPPAQYDKLLQAKQAADLHTSGFTQRIVHELIRDGVLARQTPAIRTRYRAQRDAMQAALTASMPAGCHWQAPGGGMFFWLTLPPGCDATALLQKALAAGVAFVPGAAFYPPALARSPTATAMQATGLADAPAHAALDAIARSLRLSFVTVTPEQIADGVARLAALVAEATQQPGGRVPGETPPQALRSPDALLHR